MLNGVMLQRLTKYGDAHAYQLLAQTEPAYLRCLLSLNMLMLNVNHMVATQALSYSLTGNRKA